MSSIISLDFAYQGKEYYMLVAEKTAVAKKYYQITLMDEHLKHLLGDGNAIGEDNGILLLDDCGGNNARLQLKKQIIKALAEYLKKEIGHVYQEDTW